MAATKVAKAMAKRKASAKAKAKGKALPKAAAKAAAAVPQKKAAAKRTSTEPPPPPSAPVAASDGEDKGGSSTDDDGAGSQMPTRAQQRNFRTALKRAPEHVKKLVDSITTLGRCQNKREKYAALVSAWSQNKWEDLVFKCNESLESTDTSTEKAVCYPQAIMVGMCGGASTFNMGLADGDVEEVQHPKYPGKKFYRFCTFTESQSTSHRKRLSVDKSQGAEADLGFDQFDFSLGLVATGNKQGLPAGQLPEAQALKGHSPGCTAAAAPPLPLQDASGKDKAWMKVDQALAAAQTQVLAGKKCLAALSALPGGSKVTTQAVSILEEAILGMKSELGKLTALSIHRAPTAGAPEMDTQALLVYLKQVQGHLSALNECTSVAKALQKTKK